MKYLDSARTQELIGQIKTRLAGKADAATTLSGYGITDAYTKTETDNKIAAEITSIYKPAGSVAFANLPALSAANLGKVVDVTDAFTTTADFVEGAGKAYPAGTNVAIVDVGNATYKYDALSGFVDLSTYVQTSDLVAITSAELAAMWSDSNG